EQWMRVDCVFRNVIDQIGLEHYGLVSDVDREESKTQRDDPVEFVGVLRCMEDRNSRSLRSSSTSVGFAAGTFQSRRVTAALLCQSRCQTGNCDLPSVLALYRIRLKLSSGSLHLGVRPRDNLGHRSALRYRAEVARDRQPPRRNHARALGISNEGRTSERQGVRVERVEWEPV